MGYCIAIELNLKVLMNIVRNRLDYYFNISNHDFTDFYSKNEACLWENKERKVFNYIQFIITAVNFHLNIAQRLIVILL